ncbi:MAG TPA: Asp23/Gls24 family envelope stress response protein [bacterium]|nr:Asp23/Gls24 family envelope stress response protein [bacterium]
MSIYFENEFGRVTIGHSIIKQVILPEVLASKCFRPVGFQAGMDATQVPVPRSLEKAIKINDENDRLDTTILLSVLYGTPIVDESMKLKKRIRQAVESATGLKVDDLILSVEKVHLDSDAKGKKQQEATK